MTHAAKVKDNDATTKVDILKAQKVVINAIQDYKIIQNGSSISDVLEAAVETANALPPSTLEKHFDANREAGRFNDKVQALALKALAMTSDQLKADPKEFRQDIEDLLQVLQQITVAVDDADKKRYDADNAGREDKPSRLPLSRVVSQRDTDMLLRDIEKALNKKGLELKAIQSERSPAD